MGANGLVLASETAIGKFPTDCVDLLRKIITEYKKND
jgi:pyruvate kinase